MANSTVTSDKSLDGKRNKKVMTGIVAVMLGGAVGCSSSGTDDSQEVAVGACAGGYASLSHVIDVNAPIFEGDPETGIAIAATVADDGYLVEALTIATHTGTHLDAPGHFIEGGRTVDELSADEFVFEAYVIDVRDRAAEGAFQLSVEDIEAYETDNGVITEGSMVIIRTGLAEAYGTEAYFGDAPGFSGEAVQWLVDDRGIDGIGSDNFGPDATSDENYDATYTILLNDKVALPGLTNLDAISISGDTITAAPVALKSGSGNGVNAIACLS